MYLALNLSLGAGGISTPSPGLSYGALSLDENSADGTAIATFTATNASNPGSFSLSSVVPSGTLKFTGSELQASSTAVDYEATQTITATVSYTDDAGTHNFGITVDVQDVNEAPVGASQTLEFDVAAASDVTAPTLTTATDTANGATASTGSVSTDEANGTLYWVVTTSATAPTAAQVKLGQDNSSVAATDSGSQAVSATGAQATAATGLTASTAYTTHFMHEDAAANQSAVATASGFTTTVAAPTNTVAPVASGTATVGSTLSVTNGTWTGSPSFTYQWQADTVDIGGATSSTFDTTGRAADEVIRCVVTGTNAGGAAAANSNGITLTAAAGESYVSFAGNLQFDDTITIGAHGMSAGAGATVRYIGQIPSGSTTWNTIIDAGSDEIQVKVQPSTGKIRLVYGDSGVQTSGSGVVTTAADIELVIYLANGAFTVYQDGASVYAPTPTVTTLSGTRTMSLCALDTAAEYLTGDCARIEVYDGVGTGGALPAGSPLRQIVGPASSFNAPTGLTKTGTDVTDR